MVCFSAFQNFLNIDCHQRFMGTTEKLYILAQAMPNIATAITSMGSLIDDKRPRLLQSSSTVHCQTSVGSTRSKRKHQVPITFRGRLFVCILQSCNINGGLIILDIVDPMHALIVTIPKRIHWQQLRREESCLQGSDDCRTHTNHPALWSASNRRRSYPRRATYWANRASKANARKVNNARKEPKLLRMIL